jgi:IS1 family transposase/transposase-like protein
MHAFHPSCFNSVDGKSTCTKCGNKVVKNGKTAHGNQRYWCRFCQTSKVLFVKQNGFGSIFDKQIVQLTKEGNGIRSTARILTISPATILRKLLRIAQNIEPPKIPVNLKRIQVDELHTIIQNKKREIYVIYSWSQELKRVLTLAIGTRSKNNLRLVVDPLLAANAQTINTDGYSGYIGVVTKNIHTTYKTRNNGIERQNLNLRTHLKRLNRRTICFSKSSLILEAILKIYCWS